MNKEKGPLPTGSNLNRKDSYITAQRLYLLTISRRVVLVELLTFEWTERSQISFVQFCIELMVVI